MRSCGRSLNHPPNWAWGKEAEGTDTDDQATTWIERVPVGKSCCMIPDASPQSSNQKVKVGREEAKLISSCT